jgi:hypothetical protein
MAKVYLVHDGRRKRVKRNKDWKKITFTFATLVAAEHAYVYQTHLTQLWNYLCHLIR